MDKPSQETWLAYMEQAEGMIRDQQRLIEELRQTIILLEIQKGLTIADEAPDGWDMTGHPS